MRGYEKNYQVGCWNQEELRHFPWRCRQQRWYPTATCYLRRANLKSLIPQSKIFLYGKRPSYMSIHNNM